ncbi:sterol desaturase family protein [Larkinella soli]|uniref:sterol desaturase family protein n=1 Tax=Larkinella soli TaxID=1770527 RepID=UPI000FFB140D|nr:sterol desaturase family protein [Larkinella soli]
MPDFTEPAVFWSTAFFLFCGIFGRYLLFAAVFYWVFKVSFRHRFAEREVQNRPRRAGQVGREIGWSLLTSLIFTAIGMGLVLAWQMGLTRIYLDLGDYPLLWYVVSIPLVLFLHETYYYWLHRWMHRPGVYRWLHKTHHESITTSAWTSFSFHPLESLLQAVFIPAMAFLMPLHLSAIALILTIMTTTSAINHLNTEIYPRDFNNHWFGRWLIGATHHSLHHSQFRFNYGLYFTFWDKWMNTESPDFIRLFRQKTGPKKEAKIPSDS